jgi:hypothetical protein
LPNGDVPIYFVARAKKQWDWGMKKTIACVVAITLTFLLSPVAADEFRGALVHKNTDAEQIVPNSYSHAQWVQVEFPEVEYDTSGLWDAANHQFVIPDGVHFVRLSGQIVWDHDAKGSRQTLITKNNALFDGYAAQNGRATFGTTPDQNVATAVIPVKAGDTFQLQAWHIRQKPTGAPTKIYGNHGTWFSIEVID